MTEKHVRLASFILVILGGTLSAGERTEDVAFRAANDGTEQRYVLVIPDGFASRKPRAALCQWARKTSQ